MRKEFEVNTLRDTHVRLRASDGSDMQTGSVRVRVAGTPKS